MDNKQNPSQSNPRIVSKDHESTLRRYELIISTVHELMSFVDRDYIFQTVNDAYVKAFRKNREDIMGHHVAEVTGQEAFDALVKGPLDQCLAGQEITYEAGYEYPGLGWMYGIVSYSPFWEEDGSISGAVVSIRDITERKRAEDALLRTTNELYIRNHIDQIFLAAPDDVVFEQTLDVIMRSFMSNYGILGSKNHKGAFIYTSMRKDRDQETAVVEKDRVVLMEQWGGLWKRTIREKGPSFANKTARIPYLNVLLSNSMIVPIEFQDELIGTIILGDKDGDFDENDLNLLITIADHLAPILKTTLQKQYEEMKRCRAQEELRRTNENLELKVQMRTLSLQQVNDQLRNEIEERKRIEKTMRKISAQLMTIKEEERKLIARDLHDGIGQYLTSIKYNTENTLNYLQKDNPELARQSLNTIIPIIQSTIDEVRQMSMYLRPSILDDFGIVATVDWFCNEFRKNYSGLCVNVQIDVDEDNIPDPLKINIFRILQEALNNVVSHSEANLVDVKLEKNYDVIELSIADNGIGFDASRKLFHGMSQRGVGLASMNDRAIQTGGKFIVESSEGSGTVIRVIWNIA